MIASTIISLTPDGKLLVQLVRPLGPVLPVGPAHEIGTGPYGAAFLADLLRLISGKTPEDEKSEQKWREADVIGRSRPKAADIGDHPITKLAPATRKIKYDIKLSDIGL